MPILILLFVAAAIAAFVGWLILKGREEYQATASGLKIINELSMQEAKARALELLESKSLFECKNALGKTYMENLIPLAPEIRGLFQTYEKIEALSAGNPKIDRDLIGLNCNQPRFILIGRGMEGSDVEFDLGVLPNEEKIYEIYANELPDRAFGTYNTVYHWIVATASGLK